MQLTTPEEQEVFEAANVRLDRRRLEKKLLADTDIAAEQQRAGDFVGHTLDADQRERVRRALEERYIVTQSVGETGATLRLRTIPDWVPSQKPTTQWQFWFRYQRLMKNKVDPDAFQDLDTYTDRVLTNLGNPKLEPAPAHPSTWDVRGMVAGHVQSGKTSNYIGLICKAADAGYRLIVVLTGIHENLRMQTQKRIDDGFIGRKAVGDPSQAAQIATGVGLITVPGVPLQPVAFWGTTQNKGGDFRAANMRGFSSIIRSDLPPVVLVVKKNASVLRRLLRWVVGLQLGELPGTGKHYEDRLHPVPHYYRTGSPLLVIDDEADQASVDTAAGAVSDLGEINDDHGPKAINKLIRSLLRSFDRSAYVGYTATPFANILIHDGKQTKTQGDDLFPRDFIVNLPTPPGYVGPSTIFGRRADRDGDAVDERGLPELLERVTDHATPKAGDEEEEGYAFATEGWMPPKGMTGSSDVGPIIASLRAAIADWTLAGAALVCRSKGHEHHSMLIHVTRLQELMNKLTRRVIEHWDEWSVLVANGDHATYDMLRRRWETSFIESRKAVLAVRPAEASLLNEVTWDQLVTPDASGRTPIQQSVDGVVIRQINGGKDGQELDYEHGQLKVIAVGGNKLSRGLTLENLTVSYFLRTTVMYDTLMQMGRWFGYRPGFLDLCRLYMAPDLRSWFEALADATDELRAEFDQMASLDAKPKDFGLKVRSHPVMQVTSSLKMRDGEKMTVAFSGGLTQSIDYNAAKNAIETNWAGLGELVDRLGPNYDVDPQRDRPGGEKRPYVGYCWREVPASLIEQFLSGLKMPHKASVANAQRIAQYIAKMNARGELVRWTVFIRRNPGLPTGESLPHGVMPGRSRRRRVPADRLPGQRGILDGSTFTTKVLIDPDYEAVDIDGVGYQAALDATNALLSAANKEPTEHPGRRVRSVRPVTHGLLLLYLVQPIDPASGSGDKEAYIQLPSPHPLVGFAVSLPETKNTTPVEYVVNHSFVTNEALQLMLPDPEDEAVG